MQHEIVTDELKKIYRVVSDYLDELDASVALLEIAQKEQAEKAEKLEREFRRHNARADVVRERKRLLEAEAKRAGFQF